jgi:hypothetical protein
MDMPKVSAVSCHFHEKCLPYLEKFIEACALYFFSVSDTMTGFGLSEAGASSIFILLLLTDPQRSPTIALLKMRTFPADIGTGRLHAVYFIGLFVCI